MSRFCINILLDWMPPKSILVPEHAGFAPGYSTMDKYRILYHLAKTYHNFLKSGPCVLLS